MKNNIIFKSSVGSRNYNLDISSSDKDYKVFVYPTFMDLFKENRVSVSKKIDSEDVNIIDIRNFTQLMFKSNVNFLEVLFAVEVDIKDHLFMEIFSKRESIARMNLPYLYRACTGMAMQRLKMAQKATEGTMESFNVNGYDVKSAYQSMRILDFLKRYEATGFESFADSICYEDSDPFRSVIMDIRMGKVLKEDYIRMYDEKEKEVLQLKSIYLEKEEDESLKEYLDNFIQDRVKNELREELNQ